MNKTPCVCGNESVAWITIDGQKKRVCQLCAQLFVGLAVESGNPVACSVKGELKAFLLGKGNS